MIVSNPFSDERLQLDRQFTANEKALSEDKIRDQVIQRLFQSVDKMLSGDRANIQKYSGEDKRLIELTLAFELFHRLSDDFYRYIPDIIEADHQSRPVAFWDKAVLLFEARGFKLDECQRYFTLFFQLCRAFYFIDTNLVGTSSCMKEFRKKLWNNVFTHDVLVYHDHLLGRMDDFSTLILGGTGTGKGTAAAAIGRSGYIPFDARQKKFKENFMKTFFSINLSQFSESLIESELFGHRKGAFTGAIESHDGFFSRCSPFGAVFLDEIGDISLTVQIKLLEIIQERRFSPVGSHEVKRFKGRVIAATNKDIYQLRREGKFRDDFFYRLCSDIIHVPTLQERIQEDPNELFNLTRHVTFTIVGRHIPGFTDEIHNLILKKIGLQYHWPGNVRELEQCIRRMIIKKEYEGDHLLGSMDQLAKLIHDIQQESIDANNLLSQYCKLLFKRHGTYEAVRKIVNLDRRTVKKYVEA